MYSATRALLSLCLVILAVGACAPLPSPSPTRSVVVLPTAASFSPAPAVVPFTDDELRAIGNAALAKETAALASQVTPLRSLGNGFLVDGPCELASDAQKAAATKQIQIWNDARVRGERAATTDAKLRAARRKIAIQAPKVAFACNDIGGLLANVFWSETDGEGATVGEVQVDMLVQVSTRGVRLLYRADGSSNHSEWARWKSIASVVLAAPVPGYDGRKIYVKVVDFEGGAIMPISAGWFAVSSAPLAAAMRPSSESPLCDTLSDDSTVVTDDSTVVKWRDRLAILCMPERLGQRTPVGRRLFPAIRWLDTARGGGESALLEQAVLPTLRRQLAAQTLVSVHGTAEPDAATVRLALGILGQGENARKRMGTPKADELPVVDEIWKNDISHLQKAPGPGQLPRVPGGMLSAANAATIAATIRTSEVARVREQFEAAHWLVGIWHGGNCQIRFEAKTLSGLQWTSNSTVLVHATWNVTAGGNCNLPDKPVISRSGIFRIVRGAATELASTMDSGFAGDNGGARDRQMAMEWSFNELEAVSADGNVWLLSRDRRSLPEERAHDLLRVDATDGTSVSRSIGAESKPRAVQFRPTTAGIYLIDGRNMHVLRNGAWVPAAESDAEVTQIRAEWRLDDIAKQLPAAVPGLSYDAAYAELGVPANERAAFFAPSATSNP